MRLALLLLSVLPSTLAVAQSTVTAFSEGERGYALSLLDGSGKGVACTLPAPGGCRLSLLPGPLQVDVRSDDLMLHKTLQLPEGAWGLQLDFKTRTRGYVGVGLLAGAAGFLALTLYLIVDSTTASAQQCSGDIVCVDRAAGDVVGAFLTGVVTLGLGIPGGILAALGFSRAGPQATLVPGSELPASERASEPPAGSVPWGDPSGVRPPGP